MFLSIIIVTYNRLAYLKRLLDILVEEIDKNPSLNIEIIISDDGEITETRCALDNYLSRVLLLQGEGKGPAANRNNGALSAQGQWLLFLDDDVLPCKGFIRAYADVIEKYGREYLAFEGAIYPDDWSLLKKSNSECPININGGAFWSANICIERKLFFSINGFDIRYKIAANEDQDIYLQIKEVTNVLFVPSALVVHPVRFVPYLKLFTKYPEKLNNYILFVNKNFKKLGYKNKKNFLFKKIVEFLRGILHSTRERKYLHVLYLVSTYIYSLPIFLLKVKCDE